MRTAPALLVVVVAGLLVAGAAVAAVPEVVSPALSPTPVKSKRAKDERGMRIYYMGFLTRGPAWSPERTEASAKLQEAHLANIRKLAEDGRLLIAGPFAYDPKEADQSLRGIFIFDTETQAEAEELAKSDPAVKAGTLAIRIVPWYGPYGLTYEDHGKYLKTK